MAGWAGFSDEDLRKMKQSSPEQKPKQKIDTTGRQVMKKAQKLQQQRELMARLRSQEFKQNSEASLHPSQRLSHPESSENKPVQEIHSKEENSNNVHDIESKTNSEDPNKFINSNSQDIDYDGNLKSKDQSQKCTEELKELDEQEALSIELSRVEQFRRQQQKMEEENKQRRQILTNAIKQRSRMAKEEADKLMKVQKELNHLDNLVTADVSIIRDRIEAASMEFLHAQKRYERAEKEFVAAKIALAEKSDLKEALTEHLYTVIQQNEARKAARLASLMKELGLGNEEYPVSTPIPPLLSFSSINTLRPSSQLSSPSSQTSCLPVSPTSSSAVKGNDLNSDTKHSVVTEDNTSDSACQKAGTDKEVKDHTTDSISSLVSPELNSSEVQQEKIIVENETFADTSKIAEKSVTLDSDVVAGVQESLKGVPKVGTQDHIISFQITS